METRRARVSKRQPVEESEPQKLPVACNYCHQSKVRCSGQIPCTRCAERCLPCRPRKMKRRGRKRASGAITEEEPVPEPEPQLLARQPLLDMVLKQANPKGDAELFLRCFHQLYNQGRIVRERVLQDMRMWRVAAMLCDADPTWGIASALQRLLKISPLELEDPLMVGVELTPVAAKARAQATMARLLEASLELKQSVRFRQFDDGVIPLHVSYLSDSGGIVIAVNDAYKKLVMETPEIFDQQIKRRSIHTLISASIVAPQDREMYLRKVLELRLTDAADATGIMKGFLNDGQVRLYYVRARRVMVDGKDLIVYRMEAIPKSRHITDQPGIFHSIVKQYRHYGYTPGSSVSSRAPTPQPPSSPPPSSGARAATGFGPAGAYSGPPAATAAPGTASMGLPSFPPLAALTFGPPPSQDVNALCRSDPQRVMRVFPRVGTLPSGPPLVSAPSSSPPTLGPSMPLGVPAYPGALPPRPMYAPPLAHQLLPPPSLSVYAPPPPPPLLGDRAAAPTPSSGGKLDTNNVPILDDDMLSELLERFDE